MVKIDYRLKHWTKIGINKSIIGTLHRIIRQELFWAELKTNYNKDGHNIKVLENASQIWAFLCWTNNSTMYININVYKGNKNFVVLKIVTQVNFYMSNHIKKVCL